MASTQDECPQCRRPKDTRAAVCRDCFRTARDKLAEKTCTGCATAYPVEQFAWRPNGSGGRKRRSRCRTCESAAASAHRKANPQRAIAAKRLWEQNNPEKHARAKLRKAARDLGLDPAVILDYFDSHDGRCETCGRTAAEASKFARLTIDHDHLTGEFRGLLCSPCNVAIGQVQDSSDRLRALADYLDRRC